jgi:hypothetical protein
MKSSDALAKSFMQAAHSISKKDGKSVLIMKTLWKNNFNSVKDVPRIYANFITVVITGAEKEKRKESLLSYCPL